MVNWFRMKCPKCAAPAQRVRGPDGGRVTVCMNCGWGREKLVEPDSPFPEPAGPTRGEWIRLIALWALCAAILIGPYLALVWVIPRYHESTGRPPPEWLDGPTVDFILRWYWALAIAYVGVAELFKPSIMPETPASPGGAGHDVIGALQMVFSLLLLPGEIVCQSIRYTVKVLRSGRKE